LLITTPAAIPIIGGAIEALVPGPPGTLTISSATRLTAQEISAGARYTAQTGKALVESVHKGEEFVDAAKKTYDVMGQAGAYSHWNAKEFTASIVDHVRKVDHVIIDLKTASKAQVGAIKDFVKTLTKEQQKKIEYVK
jgi:predicted MarR family transcription regulator